MSSTELSQVIAEAEAVVAGALLFDSAVYPTVGDLTAAEFSDPTLGAIFTAECECCDLGEDPDYLNVSERLARAGKLAEVGGTPRLLALRNAAARCQIGPWVARVKQAAKLREMGERLAKATAALDRMNLEDAPSAEQALAEIVLGATRAVPTGHITMTKALRDNVDRLRALIEKDQRGEPPMMGVQTGLPALDDRWLGMEPGNLIVVGARPSMGKTAFAVNVAMHAAATSKGLVVYFSTEVKAAKIGSRALSIQSQVGARPIRNGRITDTEVSQIMKAIGDMRAYSDRILIDEPVGLTPTMIKRKLRALSRTSEIALVIVDHMHQMRSSTPTRDEFAKFTDIVGGLLEAAKEFDVPLMAMAQLNRSCESRPNRRPMMSDLRASGNIEQDADFVAFLYRDEVYNPDTEDKNVCEIISAKVREGAVGTDKFRFDPARQRFTAMDGNQAKPWGMP